MMLTDNFVRFWGKENLTVASYESWNEINFSQQSKQFLINVGLPRKLDIVVELQFDLSGSGVIKPPLLKLKDFFSNNSDRREYKKYVIDDFVSQSCYVIGIGNWDKYPIVIDTRNNDAIKFITLPCKNLTYSVFINSSIEQFPESIIAYQKCKEKV